MTPIELLPIFLNLTVQYASFVVIFFYLNDLKITFKESGLGVLIVLCPAMALYFITPMGAIIYLFLSQLVFLYLRYSSIKTVTYVSISIIIGLCSDHFASILLFKIMDTSSLSFVIVRLIVYIIVSMIITFIIKRFVAYLQTYSNSKIALAFTAVLISMIIIFYLNIYPFFKTQSMELLISNSVFILGLTVVFALLSAMFIKVRMDRYQLSMEMKENENFKSYVAAVESINNDMQKFRHDYLNILLSMKGYIDKRDIDGLATFFDEGVLKFENKTLMSSKVVKTLERLDDPALKGLLFNKFIHAHEQDVAITLEIAEPIKLPKNKKHIDLIRIVGILLDNAIENSLNNKQHRIEIALVNLNNSVLFVIRNQIDPNEFDLKNIFKEGHSTKGKGRGIGLATVKKIVTNGEELSMHYWVEDSWYNVELFIKGEGGK